MSEQRHPMGQQPGTPSIPPQGIPRPGIQPPHQPTLRPPQAAPGMHPQHPQHAPHPQQAPRPVPQAPRPVADEPLSLVEDDLTELVDEAPAASTPAPSKIKFGPESSHKKHEWKRKTIVNGTGACRLKSFHAKYSEQGMEHLDDMVNEWLDAHPDIEVKFSTTTVHVFEGKIREPALVMNVWY